MPPAPTPTRRRWFQFSLGTMLSAVAVVAVLVAAGWPWALGTYRDWRRRRQMNIIEQLYSVEVAHIPTDDAPPILSLPDEIDWSRKKARWKAAIRPEK
jgi:hypothetical protein